LDLNANYGDSLVPKSGDEFERAAKGFDIPTEGCHLAVFKVGTGFEARDVSLIDLGLLRDIDLSLADGVPQGPQCQMNASCGTKSAPEHSDGLDFGLRTSPS
jgi:hypothetical protein